MRYGLILLLISVVACQQPASTSYEESDNQFSKNSGVTQLSESATSATGIVSWTNKSGHAGKITTSDGSVFTYNAKAGHTVDGFRPAVGDAVLFNTGNGASARFVRPIDIPEEDDGDGEGNDDDDDDNDVTPPPPPLW